MSWPPRSPHEVLLASPSRKKRLESARRDVSPSPVKRNGSASASRLLQQLPDDEDEDEDEETLQLKLEAIKAQLKLKKVQQAKRQARLAEQDADRPATAASGRTNASSVQVPLSPTAPRQSEATPVSPARVLGIDKGIRAQDVSLKRASSFAAKLQAAQSRPNSRTSNSANNTLSKGTPAGKSFSERIAESRQSDRAREDKEKRMQANRSAGFGLQTNAYSTVRKARSLADMRNVVNTPAPKTTKTAAASAVRPTAARMTSEDGLRPKNASRRPDSALSSTSALSSASTSSAPTDPALFDSFSGLHLSKRVTPQATIAKHTAGMDLFTIPQLFKVVKSPHYDAPEVEGDFVVIGAIASKTNPINHKKKHHMTSNGNPDEEAEDDQAAGRAKFMVLKLTDLKWELDVFLFGTGFSHFWKLSVGTIVGILNPGILPPVNKDTGKFSLKITSSEDTVVEIGSARDLGFCTARKADGKECSSWIDLRKTEVCEYHISLAVDKAKRGRMEVNTMTGTGARPLNGHGMFGGRGKKDWGGTKRSDELKREGMFRDKLIKETVYIATGSSAAQILDQEERELGGALGLSRAELSRKRFAEKEKERELAKKLGSSAGSGVGGEYMRRKTGNHSDATEGAPSTKYYNLDGTEKLDAGQLGLLGNRAADVSLSPTKRKRGTNNTSEPVGWGGAYRRGLPSPVKKTTTTTRETREPSPVKKRARLLLDGKGVREPGRESLGVSATALVDLDDDDDDDLEIIGR